MPPKRGGRKSKKMGKKTEQEDMTVKGGDDIKGVSGSAAAGGRADGGRAGVKALMQNDDVEQTAQSIRSVVSVDKVSAVAQRLRALARELEKGCKEENDATGASGNATGSAAAGAAAGAATSGRAGRKEENGAKGASDSGGGNDKSDSGGSGGDRGGNHGVDRGGGNSGLLDICKSKEAPNMEKELPAEHGKEAPPAEVAMEFIDEVLDDASECDNR